MRRGSFPVLLTLLAALALPSQPASAHPADPVVIVTVSDDGYSPESVEIEIGQSVQWRWETNLTQRSVTTTSGPEKFDSKPQSAGFTFLWNFREPYEYMYHSTTGLPEIAGTLIVKPYPGKPPRIRRLRVRDGSSPKARFRLNKRGDVVGRVQRRRGGEWRTANAFSRRAHKGRNSIELPSRGLDPGRYRLKLTAYDHHGRKDSATDRFRLR